MRCYITTQNISKATNSTFLDIAFLQCHLTLGNKKQIILLKKLPKSIKLIDVVFSFIH